MLSFVANRTYAYLAQLRRRPAQTRASLPIDGSDVFGEHLWASERETSFLLVK